LLISLMSRRPEEVSSFRTLRETGFRFIKLTGGIIPIKTQAGSIFVQAFGQETIRRSEHILPVTKRSVWLELRSTPPVNDRRY